MGSNWCQECKCMLGVLWEPLLTWKPLLHVLSWWPTCKQGSCIGVEPNNASGVECLIEFPLKEIWWTHKVLGEQNQHKKENFFFCWVLWANAFLGNCYSYISKRKTAAFKTPGRNTPLPWNRCVGECHALVKDLQKLECKRSWSMIAPALPPLATATSAVAFLWT